MRKKGPGDEVKVSITAIYDWQTNVTPQGQPMGVK